MGSCTSKASSKPDAPVGPGTRMAGTETPEVAKRPSSGRSEPSEPMRGKVWVARATSSVRSSGSIGKISKSAAEREVVCQALRDSTLLGALPESQFNFMIDLMEIVKLSDGQHCEITDCVCVVLRGELKEDDETNGSMYPVGSVLGEVGLLYSTGIGCRVLAIGSCRVAKLTRRIYNERLEFTRQNQIKANARLLDSIPLFEMLTLAERLQIADACTIKTYGLDEIIIREGEAAQYFYVLRSGEASVMKNSGRGNEQIDYKYPGDFFGECALLDSAPRNATVISATRATETLCLNREIFKMLVGPLSEVHGRTSGDLQALMLVAVPLFSELTATCREKLRAKLKHETFEDGDLIFRQGDLGDKMYIILTGAVSVLHAPEPGGVSTEIDLLHSGQYFGERALLKKEPRMASTQAKEGPVACVSLTKATFEELLLGEEVSWRRRWEVEDTRDVQQLQVLRPMGNGAFGTAWLVQHRTSKKAYALKALPKERANSGHWAEIILREKELLASLPPHHCVVTLYNTFQDPINLYMLMEVAPGGELYHQITEHGYFSPGRGRFYCGCVTLALRHLHQQNIIFRDLKPENLLLDARGYLKLIDLGFARRLRPGEKAYTLCGTPYYLAPEMIYHSGHGKALDWWTFGILTFEMTTGKPPFRGENEMEVYRKVTKLQYSCPPYFSNQLKDFLRLLLLLDPNQRLGNRCNGAADVMGHPWFERFDWEGLADGSLTPPHVPTLRGPCDTAHKAPRRRHIEEVTLDDVYTDPTCPSFWKEW